MRREELSSNGANGTSGSTSAGASPSAVTVVRNDYDQSIKHHFDAINFKINRRDRPTTSNHVSSGSVASSSPLSTSVRQYLSAKPGDTHQLHMNSYPFHFSSSYYVLCYFMLCCVSVMRCLYLLCWKGDNTGKHRPWYCLSLTNAPTCSYTPSHYKLVSQAEEILKTSPTMFHIANLS